MLDLIVKNGRVVLRDRVETTSIGVKDGKIVRIAPTIDEEAKNVCDAAGCYVLPGMVDAHMHLSEPGRTEWEGYETGTKAMAAGGITSFVNSAFAAFNTPIFVCLLCGFFWKKVPAIAAKIVIPVHVVLYFILQFGLRNVIPALNNIHYLYFTAILFVFDMLLMWVIVKKHPRATDFELKDVGAVDLTPWKNGKIWATVTLLIMVLAYVIFSPLGFGKSEKTTYQNYLENQTTASVSDSVQ